MNRPNASAEDIASAAFLAEQNRESEYSYDYRQGVSDGADRVEAALRAQAGQS